MNILIIIDLVYIPYKEMNVIEKALYDLMQTGFIKAKLPKILEVIDQAFVHITEKGKKQGFDCGEDVEKDILGRCIYECLNKLIYEEIRTQVV